MKPQSSFFLLSILFLLSLIFNIFSASTNTNAAEVLLLPSWRHLFGTDSLGRDYFIRVLQGTEISYIIGLTSAGLSISFGSVVGIILGTSNNKFYLRLVDVFQSIPTFALATVLCLFFQNLFINCYPLIRSMLTLILSISLSHWMDTARIVRSHMLKILVEPYVESATAIGASRKRILFFHIIPQMTGQLSTLFILYFPQAILYESFMSFVGLGIQSPATSWGSLIHEGWSSLSAYPHLILFPGMMLFLTLLLLQAIR